MFKRVRALPLSRILDWFPLRPALSHPISRVFMKLLNRSKVWRICLLEALQRVKMTSWCTHSILLLRVLAKVNRVPKTRRTLMVEAYSLSKSSIMLKVFQDLKVLREAPTRLNSNHRVPSKRRRRGLKVLSRVHPRRVWVQRCWTDIVKNLRERRKDKHQRRELLKTASTI